MLQTLLGKIGPFWTYFSSAEAFLPKISLFTKISKIFFHENQLIYVV